MNGLIGRTSLVILFIISVFAQTNVGSHLNGGIQTVSGQKITTDFRSIKPVPDTLHIEKPRVRNYTLLIYMIGSDLDSYAKQDIQEMIEGSQNSRINIVLETGGGTGIEYVNKVLSSNNSSVYNDKIPIDFTRVQRHVIANGTLSTVDLGRWNMADSASLADFIEESELQFPAKKYAIILWDHGSGLNGFGNDIVFNKSSLRIYQLKNSFDMAKYSTGTNFEFIGIDACLMASAEIASALQNSSHFLIGSQEVEPPWSWDYTAIIKNINSETLQPGNLTGKIIVDSFAAQSKKISSLKSYGLTDKEITLSVIDLRKIPQLTKSLDVLADGVTHDIVNAPSAINLSKSIESTESYGLSYTANTGLVDIYDLVSNIKSRFPNLNRQANAVMDLINDTVIYKYDGDARPNAHGLSIYFPFQGNFLTMNMDQIQNDLASKLFDPSWNKLSDHQLNLLSTDHIAPAVTSIEDGEGLKIHVYGADVSHVLAKIVTNSGLHGNLFYVQSIEPHIDRNGFFNYSHQKILKLCNETSCLPVTMKLVTNGHKQFVFIPARIESDINQINKRGSLLYEISNKGFEFLGFTQEINPDATISKERFVLGPDYKIFVKALPFMPQYHRNENIGENLANPSKFIEDGPLLVHDPAKIVPRYDTNVSNFGIQFVVCDYENNCNLSRLYYLNLNHKSPTTELLPKELQSGYDAKPTKIISSLIDNNFTTYVNPELGFKIQYPSSSREINQDIYDNSTCSLSKSDPKVVSFLLNPTSSITISVDDWPFRESPKALFDFYNKSSELPLESTFKLLSEFGFSMHYTIISHKETTVSGHPAFEFSIKYSLPEGVAPPKDTEITNDFVTVLMNGRMYTIKFYSPSWNFQNLIQIKNYMLNSFDQFTNYDISNYSVLPTKSKDSSRLLSTYLDKIDGFSLIYPSDIFGRPTQAPFKPPIDHKVGYEPITKFSLGLTDNPALCDPTKFLYRFDISSFFLNQSRLFNSYKEMFGSVLDGNKKSLDEYQIMELIKGKTIDSISLSKDQPFLSSGDIQLKVGKAHYIEYQYFDEFKNILALQVDVYVINGNQIFKFEFVADPSIFQRYFPNFNQILNSFEILPKINNKIVNEIINNI